MIEYVVSILARQLSRLVSLLRGIFSSGGFVLGVFKFLGNRNDIKEVLEILPAAV